MAIGESAGLLFKIKADSKQAKQELAATKAAITGATSALSNLAGVFTGNRLSGVTSQVTSLGGAVTALPGAVGLAIGAFAGLGAVAVTAGAAIFALTKNAAEYGSTIFDASKKTGLSAETLTSLEFAAKQSGSSFEQVTKGVTNFGATIGQAAQGSKNAQKELEALGVTSTDLETALGQVFKTINEGKTDTDKLALAAAAFGKKIGPDMIGMISDADGSLQKLKNTAKSLGVTLTDEDIRAADAFGDALGLLGDQAVFAGRMFASELMPMITDAMAVISRAMIENKDVAREWGETIANTVRGVRLNFQQLDSFLPFFFGSLGVYLEQNKNQFTEWANWAQAAVNRVILAIATSGISEFLRYSEQVGADAKPMAQIGGSFAGGGGVLPVSRGGGKKGGGGGGAKAARDTEFQDAKERELRILAEYKNGLDRQKAELELHLAAQLIEEREYQVLLGEIRLKEIQAEKDAYDTILGFEKITAKEKEEIEHKLGVLRGKLSTQEIKNTKAVLEVDLEALKKHREQIEKDAEERKKIDEAELERLRKLREQRQLKVLEASKDRARQQYEEKMGRTIGSGSTRSQWDDLHTGLVKIFHEGGLSQTELTGYIAGLDALRTAFEGLGQAIGQVVNAWVLYGNAGTSVRKVTAQILAGIAQQAAVKAVFELAEGFAALAKAFFGIPNAGPSAAAHFKAAAIYGTVAGVAAVAGRGVAGNTFNEATGGRSGAGAGGGNSSDNERNNFSEPFRGFGGQSNPFTRAADRMIQALMLHEEATTRFMHQFGTASPGDVVMRVAESDPDIFGRANEKYLDESGGRGTERLMRRTGMAT